MLLYREVVMRAVIVNNIEHWTPASSALMCTHALCVCVSPVRTASQFPY